MRSRVCLDCRLVVGDLPACPGGANHRVVDLASPARAALVDEVWGPPSWRRERRRLARAGGGGAAAGGLGEALGSCGGCDGCSGLGAGAELGELVGAILVILAVALIAVVLVWAIGKLIAYVRARRNMPKPNGALLPPTRHGARRRVRGVVLGEPRGVSALTSAPCVGWAIELSSERFAGNAVMLRDGASLGFDVRLEDGRVAHVPAGPLLLATGGAQDDAPERLEEHLRSVDPAWAPGDEEPAIPFDRVAAVDVRPGDEVEIFGALHLAPDPDAAPTY
ncbi:MAG: hypothetical protein HYV09_37610, partial [Deltaproteobacteria bacterium]|nr:hypothetical protein [Deltaproteobacteria bacterium]